MKNSYWLFLLLGIVVFCLLDGEPSQTVNPEDIKTALVELKDSPFFRILLYPLALVVVYHITMFFLNLSEKRNSTKPE